METDRSSLIVNKNTDMNVIWLNEKEEFFNNILNIDISCPRNGYHIFSSEQKIVGNHKYELYKRNVIVAEMWRKLSEKEKEVYEKKHQEEVKRYEKNIFLVKRYLLNPDIFR